MNSAISKFYQKKREERLNLLQEADFLSAESVALLQSNPQLDETVANSLIENQIGQFSLPMGVALNFIVDDREVIVPMVVEEPSVIAAASNGAKFMRPLGGFQTTCPERALIGQIILQDIPDLALAEGIIQDHVEELLAYSRTIHPSIVARGGGVKKIETRIIVNEDEQPEFLTIHLIVDVKDAMGANIVNTILEGTSKKLMDLVGGEALMTILSNYNDHSLVTATCRVAASDLATKEMDGLQIAKKIAAASRYAQLDPYRAATHNKGIMNGIDSVLIATGNDPRAVAAGAHAYAARKGRYQGMAQWSLDEDNFLIGQLTLPMPIGSVGGAISVLPLAKISQELLQTDQASELARIIVAVGLAQNFSALKALVTEGIQRGHMSLHAKSLAIHAGAIDAEVEQLTTLLTTEKSMSLQRATELLSEIRN